MCSSAINIVERNYTDGWVRSGQDLHARLIIHHNSLCSVWRLVRSIVCGVEGSGVSDLVCLLQSDARRQLGPAPDVCSDADREGREGNIMGRV